MTTESNEDPNSLFKLAVGFLIAIALFLAGITSDKKLFQWILIFFGSAVLVLSVDWFSPATSRPHIKNIIYLCLAAVSCVIGAFMHDVFILKSFLFSIGMSMFCLSGVRMLIFKAVEDSESEEDKP